MKYSATSQSIYRDGKKIATIVGWWDAQMSFYDLKFVNDEEKKLWKNFYESKNKINYLNQDLILTEGDIIYQLIWEKI